MSLTFLNDKIKLSYCQTQKNKKCQNPIQEDIWYRKRQSRISESKFMIVGKLHKTAHPYTRNDLKALPGFASVLYKINLNGKPLNVWHEADLIR